MSVADHVRVLSKAAQIQTRRARHVDPRLAEAIRQACSRSPAIVACYLLDTRRQDTGKTALLVAIVLDDEEMFPTATQGFPEAMRSFSPPPEVWIISAEALGNIAIYRGTEFYMRPAAQPER